MINGRRSFFERILAACLAVMLVFIVIPFTRLQAYAESKDYEFNFTVSDKYGKAIEGATVKVYLEKTSSKTTSGGDTSGGDVSGGDVSGGDVSGGDVSGGDVSGGDVSGGDVSGGDVSGGDVSGGDISGGDVSDGDASSNQCILSGDTDAKGEVKLTYTHQVTDDETLKFTYVVSKDEYVDATGTIDSAQCESGEAIKVSMIKVIEDIEITTDKYTLTNYEGTYDGEAHSVEIAAEGFDIKYGEAEDGIFSEQPIEMTDVGKKTVYIQLSQKGYITRVIEGTIEISRANQTDFLFSESKYEVDYGTREFTVVAEGGQSQCAVSYCITDGNEIGTIDAASGVISFNSGKTGTMTVKAVREEDKNYSLAESTCLVEVKKVDYSSMYTLVGNTGANNWYVGKVEITPLSGFEISTSNAFSTIWESKLTYETEGKNENITVYIRNSSTGAISEAITVQTFFIDKSKPTNLNVSYSTSILDTIINAISLGFYRETVTVTLSAEDAVSGVDHFVYNIGNEDITIAKDKLTFDGNKATASFRIEPQFKGSVSATVYDEAGWSMGTEEEKVLIVDNVAPGVTVKYDNTNATNTSYYHADRIATIEIVEENFDEDDVKIIVGKRYNNQTIFSEERIYPTFVKQDGKYTATVEFSEDADYTFDISYTDKSGNAYDTYSKDEFTIDKTKPVISISFDNNSARNEKYYQAKRTGTITVAEHNFRASDIEFNIETVDVQNKDVTISEDFVAYLKNQSNWNQIGDTYSASIDMEWDANYSISMNYSDLAGNAQVQEISEEFCIDTKKPDRLTINYSTSVLDKIIETITFGFYKASPTVTITATDETAGIDSFTYSCVVSENVSSTNTGVSEILISSENITYSEDGKVASAEFKITPQFRGYITFYATDRAGNKSTEFIDTKKLVVDNVAPGINVIYDNNNATYTNYYQADRTATIIITEANYFGIELDDKKTGVDEEYLVITKGKRLNHENEYTETKLKPNFIKNGDVYTATISFDEDADYTFDITYTDYSGNVYDSYVRDEFTVDKTAPTVLVTYDNNICLNGNQFKGNRTATIEVNEHNFKATDITAIITAKDAHSTNVAVTNYSAYLKDTANWEHNGDIHTATITFDKEANYTFAIGYSDMAGNINGTVDYGNSIVPTAFTVDKTCPTASIQIGTWKQSTDGTKWDRFIATPCFGLWDNKALTITINNDDSLSGIDKVEYFKNDEILTLAEVQSYTGWIAINKANRVFQCTANPNERFIVYVHMIDKAGNESYISSDGVILDKTLPSVEKLAPQISISPNAQAANSIYSTDVPMDVVVIDPADSSDETLYSGLKSVTYEVYNNSISSAPTQEGTLFTFDNPKPQKTELVQRYSRTAAIVVDKEKNNSNDVVVKVIAVDNAGNVSSQMYKLMIDITAPTIEIQYSNNSADNEKYFKEDRIATVTVTERNFNPGNVTIDIINSDGTMPAVSNWTETTGSGNMDNTKWSATILYEADGDYEFSIACQDLSGNKCTSVEYAAGTIAGTAFTIDKTLPVIEVIYDNNEAKNTNYFDATRKATVVITEHNFDEERVVINLSATDDGINAQLPSVSRWEKDEDRHVATIYYDKDSLYTFGISVMDKAANESEEFEEQQFYIDTIAPTITITGIADRSANKGEVIPIIRFEDTNYASDQVEIELSGVNRKVITNDGSYTDIHNGRIFTFNDFEKKQDIDDIYTLKATMIDQAGNATTEEIVFSVNRYGSTYLFEEATKSLNGAYVKSPIDVVLTEVNADELKNIKITLFKNNETIQLKDGDDYKIDLEGGNGEWYQYTYRILEKNFEDDGVYRLTIHSEDAAGNVAENTLDTKDMEIVFGVDKTKPNAVIENVESKAVYAEESKTVYMTVSDNLLLSSVEVYLDDYQLPCKSWNAEEIVEMQTTKQEFSIDILGDSDQPHKMKVVCLDAAGNERVEEATDFYVTTSLWVRFYNNKPLFLGTIAGTVILIGSAVSLVVLRKKKLIGK